MKKTIDIWLLTFGTDISEINHHTEGIIKIQSPDQRNPEYKNSKFDAVIKLKSFLLAQTGAKN